MTTKKNTIQDNEMDDEQTAVHLRKWVEENHGTFAWPTDACGYDQHIKFVRHRNENWNGGTDEDFKQFVLNYAETLLEAKRNHK